MWQKECVWQRERAQERERASPARSLVDRVCGRERERERERDTILSILNTQLTGRGAQGPGFGYVLVAMKTTSLIKYRSFGTS